MGELREPGLLLKYATNLGGNDPCDFYPCDRLELELPNCDQKSVHCGPRYSWTTDEEEKELTQALGGTFLGKLTLVGNPDSANQTSGGGLIPLLPYEGCGKYAS